MTSTHNITPAKDKPYWSPYLAGFGLGLVLLASHLLLGNGLGASGGFGRIALFTADQINGEYIDTLDHARKIAHGSSHVLADNLVFGLLGVAIGGFFAAISAGRVKPFGTVERGPTTTKTRRLLLAFAGGLVMGIASRIARGCTSGQALSGGSQLALGSWAFMMAVFAGGFALAYFVRRQWK